MYLYGLTKLEQGDREPAWATVLDLAKALGVDVGAFVTEGNLVVVEADQIEAEKLVKDNATPKKNTKKRREG